GIYNDDLVSLIGRHPQIIVAVDNEPIGAIDAGGEYRRVAGSSVRNVNLDDPVQRCIGHEHRGALVVELDSVCAEGRNSVAWTKKVHTGEPCLRGAADRTWIAIRINGAAERTGDVDIARTIERHRI